MALAKEDIEHIKELIEAAVVAKSVFEPSLSNVRYEMEIRERIIRVEEELKHQRELMVQGFALMEKRLEANEAAVNHLRADTKKGFDALTRRIDRFMVWSFGITVTLAGVVIVVLRN